MSGKMPSNMMRESRRDLRASLQASDIACALATAARRRSRPDCPGPNCPRPRMADWLPQGLIVLLALQNHESTALRAQIARSGKSPFITGKAASGKAELRTAEFREGGTRLHNAQTCQRARCHPAMIFQAARQEPEYSTGKGSVPDHNALMRALRREILREAVLI